MSNIAIKGARTHNLKNIDLDIPREKLVVITGLSGSGKSSLAFDTLYAEGQRRYVESLSAYARQFLSLMEKPDVDHIEGLSPAISIEQKSTSHNPRSTIGTITEIHDYLRLLFARVGEPHCPDHQTKLQAQSVSQMVDHVMSMESGTRLMLLAPVVRSRRGEHQHLLGELKTLGFVRARIDGIVSDLDDAPQLDKNKQHTIEVVIDRLRVRKDVKVRLADSFETALRISNGIASVAFTEEDREDLLFSARFACPICQHSIDELEPRFFSFNNPAGACDACDGLGSKQFFDVTNVIHDLELSLSEGAIHGWDRRNIYYFQMLGCLSDHYGFELTTPFGELDSEYQDIILNGSKSDKIKFRYVNDRGNQYTREHSFEGIINNMERRYRETDSQIVREHLARFLSTQTCPECQGNRLNRDACAVTINDKALPEIADLSIHEAYKYFDSLKLTGQRGKVAEKIQKEISARLSFLIDVGLNYLTLSRSAETLSGGEAQRIRLASQIGAGLVGVMYILDEPSIGLHQRDNARLLNTLTRLRDLGNTVIVVEHDQEAIEAADFLVDIGPGAGARGGDVVALGSVDDLIACDQSITGQYLSKKREIPIPDTRVIPDPDRMLHLEGATGNNLKNVHLTLPIGLMTASPVSPGPVSRLWSTTPCIQLQLEHSMARRHQR